jgi:hypothetical protein
MLVSQEEWNQWAQDHEVEPLTTTGITFLRQRLRPDKADYYVAKIESVATRPSRSDKGFTLTEFYVDGDLACNTNYRLVEYFPGRGKCPWPEGQWLRDMGVIGCTRMDRAEIHGVDGKTGWFMDVYGQFELTDNEKSVYANLFNEDFTCITVSSSIGLMSQEQIDQMRAEFEKFDRETGRKEE